MIEQKLTLNVSKQASMQALHLALKIANRLDWGSDRAFRIDVNAVPESPSVVRDLIGIELYTAGFVTMIAVITLSDKPGERFSMHFHCRQSIKDMPTRAWSTDEMPISDDERMVFAKLQDLGIIKQGV
jgi:hypothetical protein